MTYYNILIICNLYIYVRVCCFRCVFIYMSMLDILYTQEYESANYLYLIYVYIHSIHLNLCIYALEGPSPFTLASTQSRMKWWTWLISLGTRCLDGWSWPLSLRQLDCKVGKLHAAQLNWATSMPGILRRLRWTGSEVTSTADEHVLMPVKPKFERPWAQPSLLAIAQCFPTDSWPTFVHSIHCQLWLKGMALV